MEEHGSSDPYKQLHSYLNILAACYGSTNSKSTDWKSFCEIHGRERSRYLLNSHWVSGTQRESVPICNPLKSTLRHYFLIFEMRELRVTNRKGIVQNLIETRTLTGTWILSKTVCHCQETCMVKHIWINHIHKDSRFSGMSWQIWKPWAQREPSQDDSGSRSLIHGYSHISHSPAPSASGEHGLTFPGVTWPVWDTGRVSESPHAMLSNVRKALADNLRK